ncbi:hypothetical protein E1A91_A12G172700v1 [Gossypium mustelinum]|uniref:Uncharacterized protein n=1 Tax=Gossypium mustelinum TaxID=34275 RepID=A0A5D2WUZ9_GOSMU|nr:hypothetical protein E1A91_A12G172700v1 [Gossypium mustelinum]
MKGKNVIKKEGLEKIGMSGKEYDKRKREGLMKETETHFPITNYFDFPFPQHLQTKKSKPNEPSQIPEVCHNHPPAIPFFLLDRHLYSSNPLRVSEAVFKKVHRSRHTI